jgi:light-regulated signal transduction histidine kinase (bacteriophytochrome)
VAEPTFAQLVTLACHDLRTPLATASGFAHTLQRLNSLEKPADRYVEMIGTASDQIADLLDLLSAAARVEAGRFEAQLRDADSRQLVDAAVRRLADGQAAVRGSGAPVRVDAQWVETGLAALGECVRRHGALEQVEYAVEGPAIAIGPVRDGVAAIALGAELKDFPAAVASRVLRAMDATVEHAGEQLIVRLPPA